MRPLDPEVSSLVREWIEKAEADLEVARRLTADVSDVRIREIVGFHCQQAAEKFLKAMLTSYQIEFPKTHDIQALLQLASGADAQLTLRLSEAKWLTPFGVEARYPGDATEMLPGDEAKAIEIESRVRHGVLETLESH